MSFPTFVVLFMCLLAKFDDFPESNDRNPIASFIIEQKIRHVKAKDIISFCS